MNPTANMYPFNPAGAGHLSLDRVVFAVDGHRGECAQYVGPEVPLGWFAARRGWEPWRIFHAREAFPSPRTLSLPHIGKLIEAAGAPFFAVPLKSN